MAKKRNWKLWGTKFREELNGVAGVTGIGGTVMGVGGFSALSGTIGLVTGGLGAIITGATFLYAGIKAFPPLFLEPQNMVGQTLQINELDRFHPPVKRLALAGPIRSGKTTLKEHLAFFPGSNSRTQNLSATIVGITGTSLIKYIAILDGAGDIYDQQITMVKQADYICILMDHNDTDQAIPIISERRSEIKVFLDQMRHALAPQSQSRKKWIKFVVTKKDLWGQNDQQDINDFKNFCQQEVDLWRNSNLADKVELIYHSNVSANDINMFANNLKADL